MEKVRTQSPLVGKKVRIKASSPRLGGQEILIEDYWQNVYGESWMDSDGNPAAMMYAMRIRNSPNIPVNNEVLYGKIDMIGHLVHISELEIGE